MVSVKIPVAVVLYCVGSLATAQIGPLRLVPIPNNALIAVGDPPLQYSVNLTFFRGGSSPNAFRLPQPPGFTNPVQWSSSDSNVATVDSNGLLTPVHAGVATITVISQAQRGSTIITVSSARLTSITVSPSSANVAKGLQQQFTATGKFADGTTQDITSSVTWNSTNPAVASVNNTIPQGLSRALSVGATTISAQYQSVQGSGTLNVQQATLISLAISPPAADIPPGQTTTFSAVGTYTDGNQFNLPFAGDVQHVSAAVTWTSSDVTIATVNSGQVTTGSAQGRVTINAVSGSLNASGLLTVANRGVLYVAGRDGDSIYSWNSAYIVSGSQVPDRTINGSFTQIHQPLGLFVDGTNDLLYSVDETADGAGGVLLIFPTAHSAFGNLAPQSLFCSLRPFSRLLSSVTVDLVRNTLFLADSGEIRIWDNASTIQGDRCQDRSLSGLLTNLTFVEGIFENSVTNQMYAVDVHQQAVNTWNNATSINGDMAPSAVLAGSGTLLDSPIYAVVDIARDKLYVSSSANNSILIWDKASQVVGNVPPSRSIVGSNTNLVSPCHMVVDPVRDELYVGSFGAVNSVLVFANASNASGNISPSRIINTPSTAPCGITVDWTR